jgi:uncharacterized protein
MMSATDGASNRRVAAAFGPHTELAAHMFAVLDQALKPSVGSDGSHDLSHILRVWHSAETIAHSEPTCDVELLAAAVILHDCVAVEKNSPLRSQASRLAAERARSIVADLGWSASRIASLVHAIEAHSFSSGIVPNTLEAQILQDADRLDAIGAIGIARCFYVAGRMGSALYDPQDFDASNRAVDDRRYAIDHFKAKLFPVAEGFRTTAGRAMAAERAALMQRFVEAFRRECLTDHG